VPRHANGTEIAWRECAILNSQRNWCPCYSGAWLTLRFDVYLPRFPSHLEERIHEFLRSTRNCFSAQPD
jgi:hypothetical protein